MRRVLTLLRSRLARRRSIAVVATAVVLVLGLASGAAYAYWTSFGSGDGQVSTGSGQNVTIATNATAGSLLRPGSTGDLIITATNPNNSPVTIQTITLGTINDCTTPAITLTSPSTGFLPATIPANANNLRVVIAGALTMGLGASNDCQGKTFTIPLTVTVRL